MNYLWVATFTSWPKDFVQNEWVALKSKNEREMSWYQEHLENIQRDERELLQKTFNGYLKDLKEKIKELEHTIRWFPEERSYKAFSYLAGVREMSDLEAFKEGGIDSPDDYDLSNESAAALSNYGSWPYHSFVVYSESELKEAYKQMEERADIKVELKGIVLKYIRNNLLGPIEPFKKEGEGEIRFIMYFDD